MSEAEANKEANKEEWRRLFEAAIKFKRQGSWQWMNNDDYFAVTDPGTGELGYCVVLGGGGMEYGLNVYTGPTAGALLQELSGAGEHFEEDSEERMHSTQAISVTFEDRDELDKEDLGLIRELGYKFRGSREWPQFRDYKPGFASWGLNKGQVLFLTHALEQAFLVAERLRVNEELFFEHDEMEHGTGEKRLHRVPQSTENGIVWRDEWLPWHVESLKTEPYEYSDELRLKQCKKNIKKSDEVWETDFSYAYMTIGDKGERPYYPRLCLWVDGRSTMIMDVQLGPHPDCRELYVEQMLRLLEKGNRKPAKIMVGSRKAFLALKNSAENIGIQIEFNPYIPALLEAKEAINHGM
ncbi:hypothetical protein FE784_16270 [Paenibacillus hemerocallicola]|uniref:Uncharacterized protein n=1 Tax=Paenibacillus hemerocallicola TaxID=1172614 RepID=A0A5C4T7S3_9BACL|nr:hypothetical protein [Paenibacillus hemerocallicola]TNJ65153.1 hypothetical protein FE784_16270 [Paenibacillus hemerocallicola]